MGRQGGSSISCESVSTRHACICKCLLTSSSFVQHSIPPVWARQADLQDVGVMPAVLAAAVHATALHNRAAHRRKREVALACQRADAVLQLRQGGLGQLVGVGGCSTGREAGRSD